MRLSSPSAGLKRLGFEQRITAFIAPEQSLPAIGQGAIGIECRSDDAQVNALIAPLHHVDTAACVHAERAMNNRLMGGSPCADCRLRDAGVPATSGCVVWWARSTVARSCVGEAEGTPDEAESLGVGLAERLLELGR